MMIPRQEAELDLAQVVRFFGMVLLKCHGATNSIARADAQIFWSAARKESTDEQA